MTIPLLDLDAIHGPLRERLVAAFERTLDAQVFILGPEVDALEREIVDYLGDEAVHAVACASGTDALILAFRALDIGPGDEVIVPAYSFTSTATAVALCGARPRFVDVEPDTLNIDVVGLAASLTPATRAVVAVHLFGRPADVGALRAELMRCGRQDVAIVEDAAQALGASLDGRRAGTLGDLATLSFFPTKNLGCLGDGGMVLARDGARAERLRLLRAHGARQKYRAEVVGYNSRLDAVQAAVLREKLPFLDGWCEARRENAATYRALFAAADVGDAVSLPVDDGAGGRFRHIYNQFNLQVRDRDRLLRCLGSAGIGAAVYYPTTLPLQPCFAAYGLDAGDHPVATAAAAASIAIPVGPGLSRDQQQRVVDTIAAFYANG